MATNLEAGVELTAVAMAQDCHAESSRQDRLFDDPLAGEFVAAALECTDGSTLAWLKDGLRLADVHPDVGDYVALRTRHFDDRIRDTFTAGGPRQVVLVAAGLDTRAYRLPWPRRTQLYELDLPGIIAFKQSVVTASTHLPRTALHALGVDLRGGWVNTLVEKGFRSQEPTLWIAEGLLMYLTEQDNDLLMARIATSSAPGSQLIVDHAYPCVEYNRGFAGGRDNLAANGSGLRSHIADPSSWLAGYGWQARVAAPEELTRGCARELPPIMDPQQPNAPIYWFATGYR